MLGLEVDLLRDACLAQTIAIVGLHVLLVLKLGINEWPRPGRPVSRETYLREYRELTRKEGEPFVPDAVWKDVVFSGFILLSIAACALYFGPIGPGGLACLAQGQGTITNRRPTEPAAPPEQRCGRIKRTENPHSHE